MPFLKLPWLHQQKKIPWRPKVLGRKGTFRKPGILGLQNYQTLLEDCLKKDYRFEDELFPADLSSIGPNILLKLPANIQWKRPGELCKSPVFFSAKKKSCMLRQGKLEDCWFLAAVEALTFQQDILFKVVPQNQSFEKKYAGIFHFKFWHFGEWVDVVVDDRLPVNEFGEFIFLSCIHKNIFWGALLEKAYAKLCGSYEDLQIGHVSEALVDFTGGVNITIKLAEAPPDLWNILTRATYSRSLIGCQTQPGPIRVLENGLATCHAYTMTDIQKVASKHGPENLVRLRNPWGKTEWKGDWSDKSEKWELLNPKEKILLRRDYEDGEFWMSLQDFQTHFVDLMICKLTPDLMSQEDGKKWMCSMQFGKWVKGRTSGGRISTHKNTFWMNPQYLLKVLRGNGSKGSLYSHSVLISLIQKHKGKHRNRMPHLPIGLTVYKSPLMSTFQFYNSNRKLPSSFFAWNRPLNWSLFINKREVTQDFRLPPGVYVIVPSTAEPHQESEFLLRVFSRTHILHELGGDSSCVLSKEIVDKHEDWEDVFAKYFVKNPKMNAVQLQRILNHESWTRKLGSVALTRLSLPLSLQRMERGGAGGEHKVQQVELDRGQTDHKKEKALQNYGLRFSLDVCRSILALLDLDSTGDLSIQEFRLLWKKLLLYQDVFQKKDIHHTGCLEQAEVHAALEEMGIPISSELCKLLAFRYGDPDLKVTFENFVCLVLRVDLMMKAFYNMSKDGKGIYIKESEWMIMTLYS
nr:calpain-14-like [Anolis sagrei ordinatus]